MNNKPIQTLTNGIIKENPVLVMLLGICPVLAVTTTFINGLGMGIATTFVLICSNITICLLKNIIPVQVRLPCYIVIIAGFVTLVEKILAAYVPALYDSLGLFLPLIAVNCVVFGRAELFASKKENNAWLSSLDGLGTGIGFTLALVLMGGIREILGSGTLLDGTDLIKHLPIISETPMIIFILPAGGFFTYAMIIAVMNKLTKKSGREIGCEKCPSRSTCRFAHTDVPAKQEEEQ
jgi:electron transport complex protein RnfE